MLTKIESVKGIGPKNAELIHELGIYTFGYMLSHYPASYEYSSKLSPLA